MPSPKTEIYFEVLSRLGRDSLRQDAGVGASCWPIARLIRWAYNGPTDAEGPDASHVSQCPRCCSIASHFRSGFVPLVQPLHWASSLTCDRRTPLTEAAGLRFKGFINLATQRFVPCTRRDEWTAHPQYLRISMAVDSASGIFALEVFDAPTTVVGFNLINPAGSFPLTPTDSGSSFEYVGPLFDVCATTYDAQSLLARWLRTQRVSIECSTYHPDYEDVRAGWNDPLLALFKETGAIQRGQLCQLPSGRFSDTHLRVDSLCQSDDSIDAIVDAFDDLFRHVSFNSILAQGRAMAMFGRRLARRHAQTTGNPEVPCVMSDGYSTLTYTGDIRATDRLLILTDVSVTGTMIDRLMEHAQRSGATIAGVGGLVQAQGTSARQHPRLKPLLRLNMELPLLDSLSERRSLGDYPVYNPIVGSLLHGPPRCLSATELLDTDPNAHDLWSLVDRADACRSHCRDRDTHYNVFIDMMKLLKRSDCAQVVAGLFGQRMRQHEIAPTAILVPHRKRTLLLLKILTRFNPDLFSGVQVVTATKRRSGGGCLAAYSGPWTIPARAVDVLRGSRVLIIDTAVAHGDTLDCLAQLAKSAGARSIGAGTILSRLAEPSETALSARLEMGFFRLCGLPITQAVIRGHDPNVCPTCQRAAAIKEILATRDLRKADLWINRIRGRRSSVAAPDVSRPNTQMFLFSDSKRFLRDCTPAVAGGVALHALSVALGSARGAFTMPELQDREIPPANRIAMVANIPHEAVDRSGEVLRADLFEFLRNGDEPGVWAAVAELLARARITKWVEEIDGFLHRASKIKKKVPDCFFEQLAVAVFIAIRGNDTAKHQLRPKVQELRRGLSKNVRRQIRVIEHVLQ